jgi:opacity protein-like surface antigen
MTTLRHRVLRTISTIVLWIGLCLPAALAQSRVRVIHDRATIWRRDAPVIVATIVKAGTLLDVVGREGEQYVVVIPPEYGGKGAVGLIAVSQVEVVSGGTPPPPRPRPEPARNRPPVASAPPVEAFGFGEIGYASWLARDTFHAVLGSSQAPMFGGGLQVREGDVFIEASVERFQKTGTRVFVYGGNVFNLGITDTVRIIPITATVGYRHAGRYVTPYAGGGVGTYLYKETSDFADSSENLSDHFTSYHILGGVEFASRAWVHAAFEVQFTTVPGALGATGASAAFNEHNLGGVHGRVKIMVGR